MSMSTTLIASGNKVSEVDITAHAEGGLSILLSHPMGSDEVPSSRPPTAAVPSPTSPPPLW